MGEIIAQTYELLEKIGSGGGGTVYLARHLRLNKAVVLKADRRKITARPELLRREVDVLKELSHTYIPQVYDFFAVGEIVYTVMDYVEGESLDKPLKRGERFSQPQVVKWAIQLLQALCYLHSPTHGNPPRGFVHSDIKPANIMCRPNGDICLIDFNIALAIGEESVVGGSAGYASPEHYGLDFSFSGSTVTKGKTERLSGDETATLTISPGAVSSSGKRIVLPDVRSDVYSVGATLYHLLSGRRPAKNATDVVPLTAQDASPQICAIIAKAMNPNPDLRYQTAADMLAALENLHENDPRMRRQKRSLRIAAGILGICFMIGGITTFCGLKRMEQEQKEARIAAERAEEVERTEKNALELVNRGQAALKDGNRQAALTCSMDALALDTIYDAQAQALLTEALGVYDLSKGYKPEVSLELPSEPLKLELSPDGTYAAVLTSGQIHIFTMDGVVQAQLPADPSALSDMVFCGDNVLLYAGEGAIRAFSLAEKKELWSGKRATSITLSEDGKTVAAVYKDETFATIYNAETGEELQTVDFQGLQQSVAENDRFADPNDNLFTLSSDGGKLGVSFSNGALWVYDLRDLENSTEIYDASDYTHFEGGFYQEQFAFASNGPNESVFAVIDTVAMTQLGAFQSTSPFHTQADSRGIYVATDRVLVKLNANTGEQTEVAYTEEDISAFRLGGGFTAVLTQDGSCSIFDSAANWIETHEQEEACSFIGFNGAYLVCGSLDTQFLRVLKLEDHSDQKLFSYDIRYVHDEARVSEDGRTVMLFRYDCFRLYDLASGQVILNQSIPDAEQVYDQQYRRSGEKSWLEVIYNDGTIRSYSAEDGTVMSEEQGPVPDETLYEEFFTDHWKITSPLHGTPEIYDLETGEWVRDLEQDAYLTYVTQLGSHVMTEYVSADGSRYGLLLDENGDEIARLPGLCDIRSDGTLVFDDMRGGLYQSKLYTLEELMSFS